MIEILRRLLLVGGLFAGAWQWYDSPERLFSVTRPDFAKEYERQYGERRYAFPGAMEMGREFLRKHTDPGGVAEFRSKRMAARAIAAPAEDLSGWIGELDQALAGTGPLARRAGKGQVYYLPGEAAVRHFAGPMERIYKEGAWLNAYAVVSGGDLEIWIHPEPRESGAPAWMLYPEREWAWVWMLGALAIYLVLPRSGRGVAVRHDPIPIVVLDFAGASVATFFFALPLFVYDSNRQAAADWLGGAGLSWMICGGVVLLMMSNAARAAFAVTFTGAGLRISGVSGVRDVEYRLLSAVQPLEEGPERMGIRLSLRAGEAVDLKWSGLMNFPVLLDELRRAGYYRPSSQGKGGLS